MGVGLCSRICSQKICQIVWPASPNLHCRVKRLYKHINEISVVYPKLALNDNLNEHSGLWDVPHAFVSRAVSASLTGCVNLGRLQPLCAISSSVSQGQQRRLVQSCLCRLTVWSSGDAAAFPIHRAFIIHSRQDATIPPTRVPLNDSWLTLNAWNFHYYSPSRLLFKIQLQNDGNYEFLFILTEYCCRNV